MIIGSEYIIKSSYLRGLRKYEDAIDIIEKNIDNIDVTIQTVAWLAAFYAAKDAKNINLANKYAKLVAEDDNQIPSIQNYLNYLLI